MFINFFYDDNNYVLLDFRLSNLDKSIKLKILWTDFFFFQRCLFIVATISWPYGISLVAKNIMSGLPIKIRMTENFYPIFLINILRTL